MSFSTIQQISDHPHLTKAEEQELGYRSLAGDQEARDTLVRCNLALVCKVSHKFKGARLTAGDCISIGTEGLIKAARLFDPEKGFRFSTLAVRCITTEIIGRLRWEYVHNKEIPSGHIPVNVAKKEEVECSMERKDRTEQLEMLEKCIAKLSSYDQYLLRAKWGLAPHTRPSTNKELGKVEGITHQGIQYKVKRAEERLRALYLDL